MTQANKHTDRRPHTIAYTHLCTASHTQRDPTPSHPPFMPSPGPHMESQSEAFISRAHTCTAAHTSPDQGLKGQRSEGQGQISCPSTTMRSPTWSHQPTSHGLEQVSQKKSTKGILES